MWPKKIVLKKLTLERGQLVRALPQPRRGRHLVGL